MARKYQTIIRVHDDIRKLLDSIKLSEREPYNTIIERLIKVYMDKLQEEIQNQEAENEKTKN